MNVFVGPTSEKEMTTGVHIVSDVYCIQCCIIIGWTYIDAVEEDQKYKIGKFIIEKSYMSKKAIVKDGANLISDPVQEEPSASRRFLFFER